MLSRLGYLALPSRPPRPNSLRWTFFFFLYLVLFFLSELSDAYPQSPCHYAKGISGNTRVSLDTRIFACAFLLPVQPTAPLHRELLTMLSSGFKAKYPDSFPLRSPPPPPLGELIPVRFSPANPGTLVSFPPAGLRPALLSFPFRGSLFWRLSMSAGQKPGMPIISPLFFSASDPFPSYPFSLLCDFS